VTASTDPDGECGFQPASSCGPTGNGCNGDSLAPACVVWASGTECSPQVCSTGIETAASYCDGDGTCVDGGATPCGTYRCDSQGLACETTCSDDGPCAATAYCDTSSSACVAKKTTGLGCTGSNECVSGYCANGYCCGTACLGNCETCDQSGSIGTCTVVGEGAAGDPSCSPYFCDGANGSCPSSCVDNTDCVATSYCDNGTVPPTCFGKKGLGGSCTNNTECQSDLCVDGYCCSSPCAAFCQACNVGGSLGTCTDVPAGTNPDGDCSAGEVCNGSGGCIKGDGTACTSGTECLSGYCVDGACCESGCVGQCRACSAALTGGADGVCGFTTAGTDPDNDCVSGLACDGSGFCKKEVGETCSSGPDCLTGLCVDGVCCASACAGTCEACNLSGSLGTCTAVPWGADPASDCPGGTCNGARACALPNGQACLVGTDCITGECVDGVCCNVACGSICSACTAAKTGGVDGTCDFVSYGTDPDTDCTANQRCDGGGACKKVDGQTCGNGAECLTGNCIDGHCCDTVCGGICEACDGALTIGANGVCSPVTAFSDPDGNCPGGSTCDGAGTCKKLDGQGCSAGTECMSGNCPADDSVCCDTLCDGTCDACLAVKSGGTDGVCSDVPFDQDPDGECGAASQCNGADECKLIDGETCGGDTDCLNGHCVDGVCCDTACNGTCYACSAAKTGGTDGVCDFVTINTNPDGDCVANNACDGAGACKLVDGQTCGGDGECIYGHCVDGYCCNSTCAGTCESCDSAVSDGANGVCSPVTARLNPGGLDCAANEACDGARACKLLEGELCGAGTQCLSGNCPAPDGVCCDLPCNGLCEACIAARTPSADGVCDYVDFGSNADNDCAVGSACDGSGFCKAQDGQPCGTGTDCLSDRCPQPDGVCCDTACTADCYGCTVGRTGLSTGVCGPIVFDTDPDGECTFATQRCDGTGVCRHQDGAGCGVAGDCLSTHCANGFCCNVACDGTCDSCASSESDGPDGVCSPVTAYTNPGSAYCSPGYACDGAYACKLLNGQSCSIGTECISDQCPGDDGVCCNAICDGLCEACLDSKTDAGDGLCAYVRSGDDPDGECQLAEGTGYTCDGTGICRGTTAVSTCTLDDDCHSRQCSLEPGLNPPTTSQNICCSTACGAECYSCLEAKTGNATGTCDLITDGSDPDDECVGGKTCQGGACSN
jgi:hypothetical protein